MRETMVADFMQNSSFFIYRNIFIYKGSFIFSVNFFVFEIKEISICSVNFGLYLE